MSEGKKEGCGGKGWTRPLGLPAHYKTVTDREKVPCPGCDECPPPVLRGNVFTGSPGVEVGAGEDFSGVIVETPSSKSKTETEEG